MAFDWNKAAQVAVISLGEASKVAPSIGSEDHFTQASQALDAAATVAAQTVTDPQQLEEAKAAYSAASGIIALLAIIKKK